MKKLFANKTTLLLVIGAFIIVAALAWLVISMTATQRAVVLNSSQPSGTTITEGMLKEIDVPRDTPGDFKKSKQSLIGERLTVNVEEGQLIYKSNVTSGIDFKKSDNDEFINCSILLDDEQAMGGLLTAGNKVDVAVMPKNNKAAMLSSNLPGTSIQEGKLSFILSNVTLLDTTTSLSSQQGSTMSVATTDGQEASSSSNKSASYYMLALSYNDYKKLRIAEANGTLYLNMCPKNNDEHAPLLDKMSAEVDGSLRDSAAEPIEPENKNQSSDDKNKESDNKDNNSNNNSNNDNNNNANKDED